MYRTITIQYHIYIIIISYPTCSAYRFLPSSVWTTDLWTKSALLAYELAISRCIVGGEGNIRWDKHKISFHWTHSFNLVLFILNSRHSHCTVLPSIMSVPGHHHLCTHTERERDEYCSVFFYVNTFLLFFCAAASSNTSGFSVVTGFSPLWTSMSGKINVTFSSLFVCR